MLMSSFKYSSLFQVAQLFPSQSSTSLTSWTCKQQIWASQILMCSTHGRPTGYEIRDPFLPLPPPLFFLPPSPSPGLFLQYVHVQLHITISVLQMYIPSVLQCCMHSLFVSLLLRFWVSIIKNPEFAFDIHKTSTVDSCLSVISQAYIDACATSDIKYTKDTPSAKLLYVNEVNRYKDEVKR